MKNATRTGLLTAGTTALLAFVALLYFRFRPHLPLAGVDSGDLGGGVMAALILWLALRGKRPLAPRTRLLLGIGTGVGLLLGVAVFFMK